ncbi:MAG TPA: hypothetical protein VMC80_02975 [Patescibacteria group bacterium]|nr:hypothetical protein [Patescibacteria group bacterium]
MNLSNRLRQMRFATALLFETQFGKINPEFVRNERREETITHEFEHDAHTSHYADFDDFSDYETLFPDEDINQENENLNIFNQEELDKLLRKIYATEASSAPEPPKDDAFGMIRGRGYLDLAQQDIRRASQLPSGMSRNYLIQKALSNLDSMYMEMKDSGCSLPITLGNKFLKLARELSRAGLMIPAEFSRNIAIKYFQ